jgi:hypothetical protein
VSLNRLKDAYAWSTHLFRPTFVVTEDLTIRSDWASLSGSRSRHLTLMMAGAQ